MKRRNFVGLTLIVMAFMMAAVPALAAFEIAYFNDFQKSLDRFVAGPVDGKCPTEKMLKLSFEIEPGIAKSAPNKLNGYAELANACGYPVWMMANLTGTGNNLLIQFDAKDLQGCAACVPLVYAGTTAPKNMNAFKADYKGLDATWQKHTLRVSIAPAVAAATQGQVNSTVIAISFTSLDDRAEGSIQRVGIDNLSVTLDPGLPPPPNE